MLQKKTSVFTECASKIIFQKFKLAKNNIKTFENYFESHDLCVIIHIMTLSLR